MFEIVLTTSAELRQSCLTFAGKRRLPLLLAGLFLLVQGCTTAPPKLPETAYAEAKTAYLTHDYQRALAVVGPRAIAGEPWAQYTLGYMYHYGQGVALDKQMAREWILRAAKQGYAPAQHALERISSKSPPIDADTKSSADEDAATGATGGLDEQQPQQAPSRTVPTTDLPVPASSAISDVASQTENRDGGIKDHSWVVAQDPQLFTIQLIGFSSETSAIRFIQNNHLESKSAYYSAMHSGQPWFAVIYGKFSSRDDAHQALKQLPSDLRSASPWVRSFHDIQALSNSNPSERGRRD